MYPTTRCLHVFASLSASALLVVALAAPVPAHALAAHELAGDAPGGRYSPSESTAPPQPSAAASEAAAQATVPAHRPAAQEAIAREPAVQQPAAAGAIHGRVVLAGTGEPLHGARVLLIELGLSTLTDEQGRYRFDGVPPGTYRLVAVHWTPLRQLHLRPSLVLTAAQKRVFRGETPTDGYVLANLLVSYTIARAKAMHVVSFNLTNVTDELYRNHNSLIKQLAPEIGRRFLLTYSLRLF